MLPIGFHFFERGWLSSNNLLLQCKATTLLLDTGYEAHAPQTLALVQSVLGTRALDRVANTHLHSDHCGGNALLQTHYPDLETWIPPGQSDAVAEWNAGALSYQRTGQDCAPFIWTHLLQAGTSLDAGDSRWEVHAAPGHDPHAVVLFEPAHRILMSADALWKQGFGVVFPELDSEPAFDDVARTLDLIEQLNPRLVLPGHGPLFSSLAPALASARQRLNSFVQHPRKHRHHALKVLLKFKLLACGQMERQAFLDWAARTPYVTDILAANGWGANPQLALSETISELASQGALLEVDGMICNC